LSRHISKKLERWGEKVIAAIGLDKGKKAGRGILSLTVNQTCCQDFVFWLLGLLDELAHDNILSWVGTTSILGLVGWECIQIDPALG
jgi:hypothetical protein